MIAILCTLASAAGFYFSTGLPGQWWLEWIAPIPVLWFAFGGAKPWIAFLASWSAFALGAASLLRAYSGVLPAVVLVLAMGVPALMFAVAATGARRLLRTHGPIAAMLAFAALSTGFDLLISFASAGSAASPAATEAGAPLLIQGASLVGYLGITFLLGSVASGLALGLRLHSLRPATLAAALFAVNAAFGYIRMSAPPDGSIKVALMDSDAAVGDFQAADEKATFAAIDAYAGQIRLLRGQHIQLVVLPENISGVAPAWRRDAEGRLAAAADAVGAVVVAGFNSEIDGRRCNVAWAFLPGVKDPLVYVKRQLVPVLESSIFARGQGARVLPDNIGLEICKDMDFQGMIRRDQLATRPRLLAVPAWDFGADAWEHCSVAVLRSVENGVPMARSARRGLLTLNDRYGRIVDAAPTSAGFTILIGDLPLSGSGGATLYDRIGDAFGWLCLALGVGLVGASLMRPGSAKGNLAAPAAD